MKLDEIKTRVAEFKFDPPVKQPVPQTFKTDVQQNQGADSKLGMAKFAGDMLKAKFAVRSDVSTAAPLNLTSTEQQQIDDGIKKVVSKYDLEGEATIELANQLRGKSPEYQSEFMKQFYGQYGEPVVTKILNCAGGKSPHFASDAHPSEDDTRVIAQALGNAYDSGALGKDFISDMLKPENYQDNHYLGNLVGATDSKAMKEEFFDQSMKIFNDNKYEFSPFYISGAANALAGDPELLQAKLAEMNKAGTLEDFLKNLDPKNFSGSTVLPEYDNAYAKIVSSAARIQPPTPEVLQLFKITAEKYMSGDYTERYGMADAMSKLYIGGYTENIRLPNGKVIDTVYHSNAEFFMLELSKYGTQADGKPADPTDALALSNFYAGTVFNDNFQDRDLISSITQREINKIQYAAENYPNVDSRTKALIDKSTYINPNSNETPAYQIQQQMAFRTGRIIGAVFQGFEIAVKDRNNENAAIDSAVDMLFKIVPVDKAVEVVSSKVPGAEAAKVIGLSPDKAIEYGKEKLKEWLHKKDLNDDREEVYTTLLNIAGSFNPDLYDDYSNGYENVAGIVRDLANK